MTDQDILQLIKEDNNKVITQVYMKYHDEFIRFVRKGYPHFRINYAEDAFSECLHTLYQNVQLGKLVILSCDLKTYLFQIGKNKVVDEIRRERRDSEILVKYKSAENKVVYKKNQKPIQNETIDETEELEIQNKKVKLLHETIKQLTDPCKRLLNLFWFEMKSDKDIIELTNYKSTDTIKNQRSRCMKTLKDKYLSKCVKENLITISKKKRLLGE